MVHFNANSAATSRSTLYPRLFMLRKSHLLLCLLVIISAAPLAPLEKDGKPSTSSSKLQPAKTDDVVTDYFGTKVADPYRWMEAETDDAQVTEFLKAQNDYTRAVLNSLPAARARLLARIQELDSAIPARGGWQRAGKEVFYYETAPTATTASLMVRTTDGSSHKLLDPVQFDANGSHAAIDYFVPSYDGAFVLAGVSLGGSENSVIRVIDVKTGRFLPDAISRTQYAAPSWREDSRSFYYARLQKLDPGAPPSAIYENQRVYLHVLGTDPEQDPVIFGPGVSGSPDVPKAGFSNIYITPGSPYALAFFSAGTTDPQAVYMVASDKAQDAKTPWRKIVSAADIISPGADNNATVHGSVLYLLTDKDAPNRKLIALDLDHPDISHAKVLIPASDDEVLLGVYTAGDALYVSSKSGVSFRLRRMPYGDPAKSTRIALPYGGTIYGIDAGVLLPGVWFGLTSWTRPGQAFAYDPHTNRVSNTGLVLPNPADFSQVEAREVEARSSDGTMVPVSIVCQRIIKLNGSHPTLYEGYGAYGISNDAGFSPRVLAWVERGGVYAIAHVRGGGEFGEKWHNAGRKETKQHTIDDMIAAAHYLIEHHYTSPQHLAVRGTSAGGIAVGGAIVQHPELFAVAIDNVGMTDMLRFQNTQGGAANVPEFGDVTDPAGFKYLYAVSPYHHVTKGTYYPAVLGITGTHDPRVPSWIVAKMIARLQAATAGDRPILLRVDFDAGHGLGSSRKQREEQITDEWSFILWQTGDPDFQPAKSEGRQ
jgi:prolyl oligopeptidase